MNNPEKENLKHTPAHPYGPTFAEVQHMVLKLAHWFDSEFEPATWSYWEEVRLLTSAEFQSLSKLAALQSDGMPTPEWFKMNSREVLSDECFEVLFECVGRVRGVREKDGHSMVQATYAVELYNEDLNRCFSVPIDRDSFTKLGREVLNDVELHIAVRETTSHQRRTEAKREDLVDPEACVLIPNVSNPE